MTYEVVVETQVNNTEYPVPLTTFWASYIMMSKYLNFKEASSLDRGVSEDYELDYSNFE